MGIYVDGIEFVTIECYKCGVPFAMTNDLNNRCLRNHNRSFYCPNGHSQAYIGKTKEQKLKERLEQEQSRSGKLEERANKISGNYTRMRKRVANGICPCCNRTFQNLLNHMKTKHPDFGDRKILKTLRLLYGLTQQTLSDETGVSTHYISRYENNKYIPEEAREDINNWISNST